MSRWLQEQVFPGADEFFSALLAEIEQAQLSIDLEMYIFELDQLGDRVMKALHSAAARGVRVRVMVDGVGSPAWTRNTLVQLEENGINARIYKPYPWVKMGFRFFPRMFNLRKLNTGFKRLNRRNHRKVCVIDEKTAWVGSMNIDEKLLRAYVGNDAWRETGLRVVGEAIQTLRFAFERAWMMAWAGRPRSFQLAKSNLKNISLFWRKNPLVRLNLSFFLRNLYYQDFLERLHTAHHRIWITSAYFIPSGPILKALSTAAGNGIDVRILVSKESDVRISRWVTSVFLLGLLQAGVRVFEYEPRILHAKSLLIDDWASVGSSNMNHRSLIHDLEVDVVLEEKRSLSDLVNYFERDLRNAKELTLEAYPRHFSVKKILGRCLFFFRYWL